ncbi:MAG TPA: hypothetical protein DCO89_02055 [Clostridiales bacterium]|nr:hypothetical protein [Clostridiales bacterium]
MNMKSKMKVMNKYFLVIMICALCAIFCASHFVIQKPTAHVHAETTITSSTEIHNNGEILSSKLWVAVKNFYTANKNSETDGRIHSRTIEGTEEEDFYFYPDIFKNFNVSALDLSNKGITDITNFGCLDLNSFTTLNLSNNAITKIENELKNAKHLQEIDLSNNKISSFTYKNLNIDVYSSLLTTLNLSNNQIATCDISAIAQGNVNLQLNYLTKEKLTLPTNLDVEVELSHNLIDEPNTTNPNIKFGFQGVKDNYYYILGKKIHFDAFESISSISVYSLTQTDDGFIENQLVATINDGEEYLFALGYYKVKFVDGDSDSPLTDPITLFIRPKAPTIKMIVDEEEQEVSYMLTKPTVYKFYGDENATFEYYLNNSTTPIKADHVEIKYPGINILNVYQIIDGYRSEGVQLFITYQEPQSLNWIFTLVGALVFAIIFYVAIKGIPFISKIHIGRRNNNKKDKLD